jgi:hypothetical protein
MTPRHSPRALGDLTTPTRRRFQIKLMKISGKPNIFTRPLLHQQSHRTRKFPLAALTSRDDSAAVHRVRSSCAALLVSRPLSAAICISEGPRSWSRKATTTLLCGLAFEDNLDAALSRSVPPGLRSMGFWPLARGRDRRFKTVAASVQRAGGRGRSRRRSSD